MGDIEPGMLGSFALLVEEQHTAASMGNPGMDVLATPYVVWMMEAAAHLAIAEKLRPGQGAAGIRMDIRHVAPTAAGRTATAECRLEEVDGRRLVFRCTVKSGKHLKAEARYESMLVDLGRILERARREE